MSPERSTFLKKFLPGIDANNLSDKAIIELLNSFEESDYFIKAELRKELINVLPFNEKGEIQLEELIWTSQGEQMKLQAMTDNHVKNAYHWIHKNNPKNLHWMYILLKEGERRYTSFWDLMDFRF